MAEPTNFTLESEDAALIFREDGPEFHTPKTAAELVSNHVQQACAVAMLISNPDPRFVALREALDLLWRTTCVEEASGG